MTDYVLSCCSTVDLSIEKLKRRNILFKPFHFFLDDKEFEDDMFTSMTAEEFYGALVEGAVPKTSQINAEEYYDYFEKFAKNDQTVVHVVFSSGLSGSYNSALIALSNLKEKYPNFEIYLIDSLCASSGYGLFLDILADKRNEGLSAKELYNFAENLKLKIRHDFYSTDLTFYVRGGRVSKTAGFIGNVLKICPVLDMNDEGKLIVRKKVRGKIKAAEALIENMLLCAENGREYDGKCFISNSNFEDEANRLKNLIEENFQNLKGKIEIFSIGPTIGSHSGPGTVALFYVGSERIK